MLLVRMWFATLKTVYCLEVGTLKTLEPETCGPRASVTKFHFSLLHKVAICDNAKSISCFLLAQSSLLYHRQNY